MGIAGGPEPVVKLHDKAMQKMLIIQLAPMLINAIIVPEKSSASTGRCFGKALLSA